MASRTESLPALGRERAPARLSSSSRSLRELPSRFDVRPDVALPPWCGGTPRRIPTSLLTSAPRENFQTAKSGVVPLLVEVASMIRLNEFVHVSLVADIHKVASNAPGSLEHRGRHVCISKPLKQARFLHRCWDLWSLFHSKDLYEHTIDLDWSSQRSH